MIISVDSDMIQQLLIRYFVSVGYIRKWKANVAVHQLRKHTPRKLIIGIQRKFFTIF
jgi:hypothetical protein